MNELRRLQRTVKDLRAENKRLRLQTSPAPYRLQTSHRQRSASNSVGSQTRNFKPDRFDTAIRDLPMVVFSQDRDLRYTWIYNLPFGMAADHILGKRDSEVLQAPQDAATLDAIKQQVLQTGVSVRQDVCIHFDGVAYYYDLTVEALQSPEGQITGVTCAATDITRYKLTQQAEQEQRALAEALHDSAIGLTSSLDLGEVLDHILINIGRVVPHDAATIFLIEDGVATVVRSRGYGEHGLTQLEIALHNFRIPILKARLLEQMVEQKAPLLIPYWDNPAEWAQLPGVRALCSFVGAPIIARQEVVGFIILHSLTPNFFMNSHSEHLRLFATQSAIALQNAEAHRQAKALAILQERQRLARELHDAVTQTLFTASLLSESLPRLAQADQTKMMNHLNELHTLNRSALAEMRMLLLELRPDQLLRIDLADQLRRLSEAVKGRKRINIHTTIDAPRTLPADVQIALYRIAQEAINNIVKHSRAARVWLSFTSTTDKVELTIQDNGQGFDPETVAPGKGLDSIRERAQELQAACMISSQPGEGTTITIRLL